MNNNIYLIIGKNIKKYRRLKKITQKELSIKTGYSISYIKKIESNLNYRNFSIKALSNISKALDIDIKNLFFDKDI